MGVSRSGTESSGLGPGTVAPGGAASPIQRSACTAHASLASVIICAHTDRRRRQLSEAVDSVRAQRPQPKETIVVVDHSPSLFAWARTNLDAIVIENHQPPGASGARNTGADAAGGEVLVFLDDDALCRPGWLEELLAPLERPDVVGVGGRTDPIWDAGRPVWFPDALLWLVGASYPGQLDGPSNGQPTRNVWTVNMAVRTEVFRAVGGFRNGFGKLGSVSAPEDTDLSQRVSDRWSGRRWHLAADARVGHHVPPDRATAGFLLRRSFSEGAGKAALTKLRGRRALRTEAGYLTRAVPASVVSELRQCLRGDIAGLGRIGALLVGVAATGAGYGFALIRRPAPARRLQDAEPKHRTPLPPAAPGLLAELDLSSGVTDLEAPGPAYRWAEVLVRLFGRPMGSVRVPLAEGKAEAAVVSAAVWEALAGAIRARLHEEGLPLIDDLPLTGIRSARPPRSVVERRRLLAGTRPAVSVVICSRDGAERLERMLQTVLDQAYPTFETIVVDNAPRSAATRDLLDARFRARPDLRYVVEARPGLSVARNRGLREASGTIIAFLDDDEFPDPAWLVSLVEAFVRFDGVAAASGPILPGQLETPAQVLFEEIGGHSKGRDFRTAVYDRASQEVHSPLFPVPPFGAGGNMAFRKDIILGLGGFDERLGAGTRVEGGEDTAAFTDVMLAGHTVVFEPSAIVRHAHRRDLEDLERQVRGYGAGLTAFYTRLVLRYPGRIPDLARLSPRAVRHLMGPNAGSADGNGTFVMPPELRRARLAGMLRGPSAYLTQSAPRPAARSGWDR